MLRSFGYTARPADSAWGSDYAEDYRGYLKKNRAEAAARWKNPASGEQPLVLFWYREGRAKMTAVRNFHVGIGYDDPPLEMAGMARILLDLNGRLRQLETVPAQVEPPGEPVSFDWSRLFQAAGLDLSQFQPVAPEWTPLANWDQRAAWTRNVGNNAKLRVEASAWRGRPVSFRVIGPWSKAERTEEPQNVPVVQLIVVYVALLAACTIAWFNFRARKVDLHGARKLGLLYFVAFAVSQFLFMHHPLDSSELDLFWRSVSVAAINAGAAWVFYLAFEPWVRRRWPQTMVSWSRFVIKGVRDPLVGRDLLYGVAVATVTSLLVLGRTLLGAAFDGPRFPALDAFNGVRYLTGNLLSDLTNSVLETLLLFFIMFVLRVLLRKPWIALIAFLAIFIPMNINSPNLLIEIPFLALFGTVWAAVLLRFGLLAAIIADATRRVLVELPHTWNFSAWYGATLAIPLILVALVAVYGFRHALGGRKLIRLPD